MRAATAVVAISAAPSVAATIVLIITTDYWLTSLEGEL